MIESGKEAPDIVGGAKVILYGFLKGMKPSGRTEHIHIGISIEPIVGLAICKYDNEEGYYLFGCDSNWNSITDTWHKNINDAIEQAEWEYEGITDAWAKK